MNKRHNQSAFLGAAFLMATSAVGPGFLTQTSVFTQNLATSFGFVILVSVLLDVFAQLNIWRVIGVSGLQAQVIANKVFPGAGHLLSVLILFGGLVFNIGNIAGCGLGLNALLGIDVIQGSWISAVIALLIFWNKNAGKTMDLVTKVLGMMMIALTLFTAFRSNPPIALAIKHSFIPEKIDAFAILTLVGGTVGGYISFAGAHRLLDAKISGEENIKKISRSSVTGILLATLMRILLFLAVLGVVYSGMELDPANPPASVFRIAIGEMGYRFFGLVMWCAALTSVVGASFTSYSFIQKWSPKINDNRATVISIFILFSVMIFSFVGSPVKLLVLAGTANGFILPFGLGIILIAAYRKKIFNAYRHPAWLQICGWLVVMATLILSIKIIVK